MTDQLFPREPRRMKQPSKQVLRDALAKAADTINNLREQLEHVDTALRYSNEQAQRFAAELHQAKRTKPIWRK